MCGISGFLSPARDANEKSLRATAAAMAAAIAHRGPDASDTWADAEAGLAFGHRRLSIIDLSQAGAQPMTSTDGRYVLSYNGEVYNFPDLRTELEGKGHAFRGHSDTEVVLAGIVEWGLEAALARCVGMFAISLWDRQSRTLSLVRDRLGIKPLYYGWSGGVFMFGSELAALKAHPAFRATIDLDVLALYMMRNCVPAPHTIHHGIKKLMPGTILTLPAASAPGAEPTLTSFWSLSAVAARGAADPFQGSEAEATDQAEALLREAVGDRMVADRPLGVFLSGGIDSSTVAALMQDISETPVKTFSIGFKDAGYNEAEDAKAVAAHLGTEHTELYVDAGKALDVVPNLARIFDEPFADSSQVPTYLVSEMARRDVVVCLSGDGGDEMFGGYNRYLWVDGIARRSRALPGPLRGLAAAAMTSLAPDTWDSLFRTLGPMLPGRLRQRNPGDKLHKMAGIFTAGDPHKIYQGLVGHWQPGDQVVREATAPETIVERPGDWPELPGFTEQMMHLDGATYMADDILTKVDRASMAVSLEARVPLLDHRVVEFAWRLPLALKTGGGVGKRVLRNVLSRHVPNALIERPKMGFALPIHDWLRGPLRDWAEALLDETRLRQEGFFDPVPVREKWRQHLSGQRNWQHHLWDVLMFQAWLEEQGCP
jgi:asparagine synthase (glutamine-hydrolysing)